MTTPVAPAKNRGADTPPGATTPPGAAPPPHAPELNWLGRLLGRFHVTGVFWFRFHRWGVSILPEWGMWLFTLIFTTFFFVALRGIRRAIAANLDVAIGRCGWWTRQVRLYKTMWNFAWCLSERYEHLNADQQAAKNPPPSPIGEDIWNEVLASDEGFILVTAHVGPWEAGTRMVPGRHVHVVREEEMDPRAQKFILELFERQTDAGFTMHFAGDDPALGLFLLKALRKGDLVAVQGDRPRARGRSCRVELFGHPIDIPAGPAALARAAGVAMLPVFVFRLGRHRSQLVFRPPVRVTKRGDAGLEEAMSQIAANVEWAIRQQPYQWFCFRELWPKE